MPTVLTMAICIALMARLYRDSTDLLDFRAAFFLAVFVFIAVPAATIDTWFHAGNYYWVSRLIRNLTISQPEVQIAETLVLCGTAVVAVPIWLQQPVVRTLESSARAVLPRIWLFYAGFVSASLLLLLIQYGSLMKIVLFIISPTMRADTAARSFSGLSGMLLFFSAVSAYYAAQRLRSRGARLLLFLPVMLLVLPAGNRGSLLSIGLIAATAAFALTPARPLLWTLTAALLLPPVASGLFRLRRLAVISDAGEFSIGALYSDFAGESLMLPTLAYALKALREGIVDFAYGMDLLLFPLWYVPRLIWPGKPMPLDFRLNSAMGLNEGDVFGTPISIFGGLYFNFTLWGYIPMCAALGALLAVLYSRLEHDRLLKVLLLTFVVDLVRVGDISRELTTVSLALVAAFVLRAFATRDELGPAGVA